MPIIGITGSFGSGKSTVAKMFQLQGAHVIDADLVIRGLLEPNGKCYKKVAKLFPDAILSNRKLNRSVLANKVFNNPRELKKLTDILYPEALKEIKLQIHNFRLKPLIVLDVPLLFEAGWDQYTDTTITVISTQKIQFQRLKQKFGLNRSDVLRRLKLQMPLSQKKQLADFIIDNSGSLAKTQIQVKKIIQRLKRIN